MTSLISHISSLVTNLVGKIFTKDPSPTSEVALYDVHPSGILTLAYANAYFFCKVTIDYSNKIIYHDTHKKVVNKFIDNLLTNCTSEDATYFLLFLEVVENRQDFTFTNVVDIEFRV